MIPSHELSSITTTIDELWPQALLFIGTGIIYDAVTHEVSAMFMALQMSHI